MYRMERTPDFSIAAEVFTNKRIGRKAQPMDYRRFDTLADAVRFIIEEQVPDKLMGTVVESGDDRFEGRDVQGLYDDAGYPFERKVAVTKPAD